MTYTNSKIKLICFVISAVTLILFCSENIFHYPYGLMSLIGSIMLIMDIKNKKAWQYKLLFLFFFSIWLPMLIASFFSISQERSMLTTISYLHFLPSTYFLMKISTNIEFRRFFSYLIVAFFLFLVLDSFLQICLDYNLFGQAMIDGKVTSIFYPKQRLGIILVLFCPIVMHVLSDLKPSRIKYIFCYVLFFSFIIVLALTLKRSAWLMFIYLLALLAIFNFHYFRTIFSYKNSLMLVFFLGVSFLILQSNHNLRNSIKDSSGLVSSDATALNVASNGRYDLWRTGLNIFQHNFIFGVGPRGYRYVYRDFASPSDFWITRYGAVQTHPHLFLIEILCETGIFGFLMFVFVSIKLFSLYRKYADPWILASMLALFPLNLHLAFYGSYWSSILWFFLGLGLGKIYSIPFMNKKIGAVQEKYGKLTE